MKYVKTDGRKWYKQVVSGILLGLEIIIKIIALSLLGGAIGVLFAKVETVKLLTIIGLFVLFILIIFGVFLLDCWSKETDINDF